MHIQAGLANEYFKLRYGLEAMNNDEAIYNNKSISLDCARGSYVAFQIVMKADEAFTLNVGDEPYFSRDSAQKFIRVAVDGALDFRLNIIDMAIDNEMYLWGEALLEQAVREMPANRAVSVWVEAAVPAGTSHGVYGGKIRLYIGQLFEEEQAMELSFSVEVYSYTLPAPSEYCCYLDLWQHPCNIARKAETPLWSNKHFEVLESYIRSLAELGQKVITIAASQLPWAGQSCSEEHRTPANLYEYSCIRVYRNQDETLRYDYSVMQRYIDLCMKYGINQEIEVFGLVNVWNGKFPVICPDYQEPIKIRCLDADGVYRYLTKPEEIDHYIVSLQSYFEHKGLLSRVRITADEPRNREAYQKSLEHIKEIAPKFIFKAALNHAEFLSTFQDEIQDFAPFIDCIFREYSTVCEAMEKFPDKRFLLYVCCGPDFPNTFVHSPFTETSLLFYITAFLRMDGFLRWNYTVWPENPRVDARYMTFPAGDTHFVLPSNSGTVLLTLRWKALKRGIEEFEMIRQLEKQGSTTLVQIYTKLFGTDIPEEFVAKSGDNCDREMFESIDDASFLQLRRELLQALSSR